MEAEQGLEGDGISRSRVTNILAPFLPSFSLPGSTRTSICKIIDTGPRRPISAPEAYLVADLPLWGGDKNPGRGAPRAGGGQS